MVTHTASNGTELVTVLNASTGGDVIELQTADYGGIALTGHTFTSDVTIQEGAGQTATISKVSCSGCTHLKFIGLSMLTAAMTTGSIDYAFGATNGSSFITADSCLIAGPSGVDPMDGGYAAFFDSGTNNCTVTKCTIGRMRIGVTCIGSTNAVISYCTFLDTGEDLIKGFGDGSSVLYNYANIGFYPEAGAHPDWIQCNSSASNIEIAHNVFVTTNGGLQGVFFGGQFFEQTFNNINIHDNILHCQLNNGIALKSVTPAHISSGVTIDNNLIFWLADPSNTAKKSSYIAWSGASKSKNVVHRNVSGGYEGGVYDLGLNNDDSTPAYYFDNFYADVTVPFGTTMGLANFQPVAASMTDPAQDAFGPTALIAAWDANGGIWPDQGAVIDPPDSGNGGGGPAARVMAGQTLTISVTVG